MKATTEYLLLGIFFCLLIGNKSEAQNKSVRIIGVEEGLSSPSVTSILQDSDGLMWFGTTDGLCSYDGKKITVYRNIISDSTSLGNNFVSNMAEDKNGNIWLSTQTEVSRLDKVTRKFRKYDLRSYMKDPSLLGNNSQSTSIVCTADGSVFINCILGGVLKHNAVQDKFDLVRFENYSIRERTVNVFPLQLCKDPNDNIYVQVTGQGIFRKMAGDTVFRELPVKKSDYDQLASQYISTMTPVNADTILITTQKAVYFLDVRNSQLTHLVDYNHPAGNWNLFNGTTIDKKGNIWFSSKGTDGIFIYDRNSKTVTRSNRFTLDYISNVPLDYGLSMFTDHSGLIWAGITPKGIMVTDPSREPFRIFRNEPNNPKSLSMTRTFGIYASKLFPDRVYVGTSGGGISILNEKTNEFERFPVKPVNDFFKTGSARSILENPDGKLWVGTWGDGLRLYDMKTKLYIAYTTTQPVGNVISGNNIRSLAFDSRMNLWIGGENGLDIMDSKSGVITHLYSQANARVDADVFRLIRQKIISPASSLSKMGDYADSVLKVEIKRDGYYCFVSVGEADINSGFSLVDYGKLETGNRTSVSEMDAAGNYNFYFGGNFKNRISVLPGFLKAGTYYLHYISDDSHSFAKWNSDAPDEGKWWGAHLLEVNRQEFEMISQKNKTAISNAMLEGSNIRVVRADQKGNVYVGYDAFGFQIINSETKQIQSFKNRKGIQNSLSNNNVQDILIDSKGMVWIATIDGLNKFNPENQSFKKYSTFDGLTSNFFNSVLEDLNGDIWVSNPGGISRLSFKPDSSVNIVNYDKSDGLVNGGFTSLVAARSASGRLYFGEDNGLNSFYPGQVNETPPRMAFTNIHISETNESESELVRQLLAGRAVSLSYNQNEISIDFATLHYTRPEKNKCSHQLVGFDRDWINDNRDFANYTNLPPGNYMFRIKGANSDGYWSDGNKSFSFTILPPWWATWWAYSGYGILLVGFVYSFGRIQKKRLIAKSKAKMLEAEHERKTKELEEARQLQLSMLPKTIPQLSNYDIAVYMKTSTEVGGDYYDFNISSDGTLTIAIGDATGHGLRAGTLVTATKSLFSTHGGNKDILFSLKEFSRCITALDFYQLSMCMTFVKIRQNEVQVGSAGMPPLFVFRSSTQTVEEHVIVGAPLGTFSGFPYKIETLKLETNDVLLLMTDGFPELISNTGEIFNYSRTSDLLKANGNSTPGEIISVFEKSALNWLQGKEADDDITFVVLKMKD